MNERSKPTAFATIVLGAAAFAFGASMIAGITGTAAAAERKRAPSSMVKPPAMDKRMFRKKRPVRDCTLGFSPGKYPNDPQHARYYCKTTGLMCAEPYKVDKVEFKSGAKRRVYYTCRIKYLNSGKSVNSKLCTTYFQNSMSKPKPGKHYFYFCISKPIKCSSDTYHAQNFYTKISVPTVGMARYDCKSKY